MFSLFFLGNTGKILALSTSGLKRSSHVSTEYPIVGTEEVEIEVETRKWSSSSDQAANEARKSHKKSRSLGYFKRPGFLSTKDHMELEPIPGTSESSSDLPRPCSSEINVPSDNTDGVEFLATSVSAEGVLDHRF